VPLCGSGWSVSGDTYWSRSRVSSAAVLPPPPPPPPSAASCCCSDDLRCRRPRQQLQHTQLLSCNPMRHVARSWALVACVCATASRMSARRSSSDIFSAASSREKFRTAISCVPHCRRPSHHRSYAALFRKPKKSEIATPSAVKGVNVMSELASACSPALRLPTPWRKKAATAPTSAATTICGVIAGTIEPLQLKSSSAAFGCGRTIITRRRSSRTASARGRHAEPLTRHWQARYTRCAAGGR
jgi:hypothetical protein